MASDARVFDITDTLYRFEVFFRYIGQSDPSEGEAYDAGVAPEWYSESMPTTLDRIQVTVTPELARALERARALWPDRPASQLVTSLALAGEAAVAPRRAARRAALAETAGSLAGAYPPGYLEELRKDWP